MIPYIVYYLHYNDERFMSPAWSKRQDYVKCVMAPTSADAINQVLQKFTTPIKIMGVAIGKEEWLTD